MTASKIRRALALALVALPLSAGAASAADMAEIHEFARLAHWSTPAACGAPAFSFVSLQQAVAESALAPGDRMIANANPATCAVHIVAAEYDALTAGDRCRVIAHEMGHLVIGIHEGVDVHTPGTIMEATTFTGPYAPCDAVVNARAAEVQRVAGEARAAKLRQDVVDDAAFLTRWRADLRVENARARLIARCNLRCRRACRASMTSRTEASRKTRRSPTCKALRHGR